MKLFKMKKLDILLASLCGGLLLTGCVGESTSEESKNKTSSKATTAQQLQDVNDESAVWGAITGSDWSGYNSDIRFAIDNGSGSDVRFFGCDGNVAQFSTQFESIIPEGYQTGVKVLADNDPNKNKLDPLSNGVYLPESLEQYQFKFGTEAYQHDNTKEQCYFGIYDADQDEYMYFKMVNDVRQFNTYSAIFNDMERPLKDAKKMASAYDEQLWAKRASINYPTLATAGGVAWSTLSSAFHVPVEELYTNYVNSQLQEMFNLYAKDYNKWRAAYLSKIKTNPIQAQYDLIYMRKKFFGNSSVLIDAGGNTPWNNATIGKFVENFHMEPNGLGNETRLVLVDRTGLKIEPNVQRANFWQRYNMPELAERLPDGPEGLKFSSWDKIQREYKAKWGKNPPNFKTAILDDRALLNSAKRLNKVSKLNNKVVVYDELMESVKAVREARIAAAAASVTELAFVVVDWFVIQPLLEWVYNNPGYGTVNTGIALLSVEEVTAADAQNWNKNHPDEKIAANTTVYNAADNNSINATAQLKFKPDETKGLDRNSLMTIDLTKVTTPWLRVDGTSSDPFLGNVGKASDKKGSSVFKMTIDGSSRASLANTTSQFERLYYDKLGLSQLAKRDRFAAPTVSVAVNSVANSGNLKTSANGLQQFGSLTGIFINSKQTARLNVSIPQTKLGSETLSGSSFFADFVSENHNELAPITVRSKQLFNSLGNVDSSIMLTRFNCDAYLKTGQNCSLDVGVNEGSTKRFKGKMFVADANSEVAYVPVYVNYHLITEPQMFSLEQYSTGTYRIFMHNTTNSKYAKVEVTGLPTGTTVVADSCSAGLAAGADCNIDYKFNQVKKDGTYNIKIKAYPSDGSEPKDFDTSDLIVQINDSW